MDLINNVFFSIQASGSDDASGGGGSGSGSGSASSSAAAPRKPIEDVGDLKYLMLFSLIIFFLLTLYAVILLIIRLRKLIRIYSTTDSETSSLLLNVLTIFGAVNMGFFKWLSVLLYVIVQFPSSVRPTYESLPWVHDTITALLMFNTAGFAAFYIMFAMIMESWAFIIKGDLSLREPPFIYKMVAITAVLVFLPYLPAICTHPFRFDTTPWYIAWSILNALPTFILSIIAAGFVGYFGFLIYKKSVSMSQSSKRNHTRLFFVTGIFLAAMLVRIIGQILTQLSTVSSQYNFNVGHFIFVVIPDVVPVLVYLILQNIVIHRERIAGSEEKEMQESKTASEAETA